MEEWIWPLWIGLGAGTLLFLAVLIPLLVWQYRRYGHPPLRRIIGSLAVSLYAAGLFAYTMLPLPEPGSLDCSGGSAIQLVPFHFLQDIRTQTAGLSTTGMLTSRVTLQVVFNVVLFLPWGMLVRGFFKRSWLTATVTGFLGSLLIESSQYTGLWFLYPCAYRLADVDDLIANTTGALIGAVVAPLFLAWMPSSAELAATRRVPRPVTVWRRWFAMLLDWLGIGVVTLAASTAAAMLFHVTGWQRPSAGIQGTTTVLLPGLLWVLVPAVTGTRASAGQKAVWLAPVRRTPHAAVEGSGSRRLPLWRSLVRALSVAGVYVAVRAEAAAAAEGIGTAVLTLALGLWILAALIAVIPTRNHRGLSYALAGAELVDARELPEPTPPHPSRRSGSQPLP
ncbi:VanZ family protein [Rothia sp. BD8]|uniref:VanZ-like domain-containing protein n=2 Tax=Rothia kristinae TaxID=37923 RepID=A0A199NSI1_9MICC|nr:VanZ family protein [Rothia kristinae]MBG7588466.1 VanZ family protein [Rothia kristinae]MCA1170659.1 VanZ family protein [Rothia kristinae]OAX51661.1 hypothetical protein AN277_0207620 [Rothia kristinae]WGH09281.1 VanZ family protein [Rothia kristinae]